MRRRATPIPTSAPPAPTPGPRRHPIHAWGLNPSLSAPPVPRCTCALLILLTLCMSGACVCLGTWGRGQQNTGREASTHTVLPRHSRLLYHLFVSLQFICVYDTGHGTDPSKPIVAVCLKVRPPRACVFAVFVFGCCPSRPAPLPSFPPHFPPVPPHFPLLPARLLATQSLSTRTHAALPTCPAKSFRTPFVKSHILTR